MGVYATTAYKWATIEDVMESVKVRNRTRRIIDDTLFIKIQGQDPMLCWDSTNFKNVYVSKADWRAASPAITRKEASVILRMAPRQLQDIQYALGIKTKKGVIGHTEIAVQNPYAYYSLDDLYDMSIEIEKQGKKKPTLSVMEIRRLFAKGYVPYKKTRDGDIIPVWDEGIIV